MIAANARAVRIVLLATGLLGQLAIGPLVPGIVRIVAPIALVGAGFGALRLPITADGGRESWWRWEWRQLGALVLILIAAAVSIIRLHSGDVSAEARMLALLLLFVQVAHALASSTRREVVLGCAIVVAMLAVGAAFAGDAGLLPWLVLALAGIAVTAALLHRAATLESADAVAAGSAWPVARSCAGPAAMAAALGVLLFLALPDSSSLHGRSPSGGATHGSGPAANGRATGGLVGGRTLDLRDRGTLSDTPMLSVPADAPRYWQGQIFDQFNGMTWTAPPSDSGSGWLPAGDGSRAQRPPSPPSGLNPSSGTASGTASGERFDVRALIGGAGIVYAPGVATSYLGPGAVISDEDGTPRLYQRPLRANDTYEVTATLPDASPARLRAAVGPDPSDPRWTRVAETIAPRVRGLANALTASVGDRFDRVDAIESYLRANETYDLDSPEPAPGDDAVDDFVFVSHQGFCEQFATAAVVMLRSVGIPARLVTGYAFGQVDAGRLVFRGTDAHAWVQVYYPGVGWVDSDPTGSKVAAPSTSSSRSPRQWIAHALTSLWRVIPGGRAGAAILVVVLALVAVGLAALLGRRRARRRRRLPFVARDGDGPALAAFLALEGALADVDRARAAGETLGEFARRLGGLVAGPGEVAAAMRCVERECYARGARRPSEAEVEAAVAVFERLRDAAGSQVVALAAAKGGSGSGSRGGGR